MNMDTIIQWNCRGIKPNHDELSLLLNEYNPIAVCLQETFLKCNDNISYKSYSLYSHFSDNAEHASGGVSILINEKSPHRPISINTKYASCCCQCIHAQTHHIMLYLYPTICRVADKGVGRSPLSAPAGDP